MAYIGVSPSNGVRQKHTYTATASQTTFSGAGAEGVSLSYRDSNYVDVYRNGVKLGDADYTATNGTSIVLGEGAAVSDIIEIVVYDVFSVADTVSKADGGVFDGNVTMAGNLSVDGNLDVTGSLDMSDANLTNVGSIQLDSISGDADTNTSITFSGSDVITVATGGSTAFTVDASQDVNLSGSLTFADNEKAIFGAGSDLQIYHTGSASVIKDGGTGDLYIAGSTNVKITNGDINEDMAVFTHNGAVTLNYDNSPKLATTSTGIDVTGTATMDGLTVDGNATLQNILNIGGTDPQIRTDTSDGSDNKTLWLGGGGVAYDWNRGGFFYAQGNEAGGHVGITAGAVSGGSIKFTTGTAERMRITDGGNVGIGTTSPSETLDVSGDAKATRLIGRSLIESSSGFSSDTFAVMGGNTSNASTSHGAVFFSKHVDSNALLVGTHDATFNSFVVKGSGNVGIGVSSPQELLHLKDGDIVVGNGTASNNAVIGRIGFSTDSSNSRFIGIESFRGGDAANADLRFHTFGGDGDNGERMRIDTAGNVGIGGTSFNPKLYVVNNSAGPFLTAANATAVFHGSVDVGKGGCIGFDFGASHTNYPVGMGYAIESQSGSTKGSLVFGTRSATTDTAPTERMRIDSSGRFILGSGGAIAAAGGAIFQSSQQNNNWTSYIENYISSGNVYGQLIRFPGQSPDNNSSAFLACQDSSGTVRLYVYSDGDVANHDNSYGAISDEKLKEQITDASSQWDDVKALRVRKFKLKEDVSTKGDSDNLWRLGVVAQEVETAGMNGLVKDNPDLIENENGQLVAGSTTTKSVKYSILYMKAVKALQEAMTRIETLETANTALEARIVALENAE